MAEQPLNADRPALPLAQAAERLGITSDALRMRFRRGRVEGFRRGRKLFIYVEEPGEPFHGELPQSSEPVYIRNRGYQSKRAVTSEYPAKDTRSDSSTRRNTAGSPPRPQPSDALNAIVELQRAELDRLLRDNGRLHQRIDAMMAFQEREQVLRQQMQGTLDRLAERLSLPSSAGGDGESLRREARAEIETAIRPVLVEILHALSRRGRGSSAAS